MLLTKTNIDKFVKNKKTNAVINNDVAEYQSVLAQRKKSKQINEMKIDIEHLKRDVEQLKQVLKCQEH